MKRSQMSVSLHSREGEGILGLMGFPNKFRHSNKYGPDP